MRKLLCILVMVCMLFLVACSSEVLNGDTDIANNGTEMEETLKDNASDKATPTTGNINNKSDNDSKAASTPMPEKGVLSAESNESGILDNKGKINILPFDEKEVNKEGVIVLLYYQDAGGSIIPLCRRIEKQNSIARAAINGLIDSTINREEIEYYGVYPVLPQGTQILGINVVDGIATIDFSSKLTNYNTEAAEKNIISSVVYTLTQFDSIKGVRIWIGGKPQKKLKFNSDISGILTRNNVLVNSARLNLSAGMAKSDVYVIKYVKEKYSYILPVSVEYNKINEESLPYKIVELLTMDFSNMKLYSELPTKTRLIDYSIKDGLLTLNFNSELRNYGGNAREEAIIRQIVYTVKQIGSLKKVKILIEGKGAVLPEGTELLNEIELPDIVNDIIEE